MSKKILLFGATGRTGQHVLSQALDSGFHVTAFVRNGAGLAEWTDRCRIVEGDIADCDALKHVMTEGFDAVLLTLGIYHKTEEAPLTDITAPILGAMKEAQITRLICMSSLGVGDSVGQGNWVVRAVQRFNLPYVLKDKEKQEALIRESGLDWTIIRPPQLLDRDASKPYFSWAGAVPQKRLRWKITRKDAASEMLKHVTCGDHIHQALQISY